MLLCKYPNVSTLVKFDKSPKTENSLIIRSRRAVGMLLSNQRQVKEVTAAALNVKEKEKKEGCFQHKATLFM